LSVFSRLFVCKVGQKPVTYSSFFFKCNIREYAGKKCLGTIALAQGWANSGPRAKCGPPQRFQKPAEAFRKYVQSEDSSNLSQQM